MSPSEFDLRAALHAGEGDSVDADGVIERATAIRHARRVRLGSIAAAVVVVGAVGVAVTTLTDNAAHRQTTSDSQRAAGGSAYDSVNGAAGGAGSASTSAASPPKAATQGAARAAAQSLPCPATPPQLVLPGGGGSGQFGSTGSLFTGTVGAVKVCGYGGGATATPKPAEIVLDGQDAQSLATSLDGGSTTPLRLPCPTLRPSYVPTRLVFLAVTAGGKAMEPIVATLTCNGTVTNGTAVRYTWQPPDSLTEFLSGLPAAALPSGDVTGRVSGSPVR